MLQRSIRTAWAAAVLAGLSCASAAAAVSAVDRERAQAFYKDARSYAATYEFFPALGSIRQAQTFDPSSLEIKAYAQRLLRVTETFEDRLRKDDTSHVFREGLSKYAAAEYGTALLCLGSALGSWPLDEPLRRFIREVEKEGGRKLDPEDVRPAQELVALRLEQAEQDFNAKKFNQALLRCRDAIVLEPDNALAYTRMGSIHYAMGQKERARAVWRQAQALKPEDEELQRYLDKLNKELPPPGPEDETP